MIQEIDTWGGSGNQAVVAVLASPGCPGGTDRPGSIKAQGECVGSFPLNLLPTGLFL